MNNRPSTSKQNISGFDDEIFEDSTILANFNNNSFRDKTARLSESNLNDSASKSALNVSALCCDEELSGYDKLTGQTWVYPTNYPVRDYQFNIINAAILKNTLVSLPTGLGKTFIAAVIMYNFYRWYPLGKIIFTAPTRPLVAQQINACYEIVAIPQDDTIEMTGHMSVSNRKTHWQTKRVFFATPQVIYNDLKSGICPANLIRCLVIDEAHRARGNYAYCQIVGTLTDMGCQTYRVLALSATPGSKVEDVVNVVKNLHIAHLELRTENCIDVAPYSHVRSIHTDVIPLGSQLTQLRNHYIEILDSYARRLKQLNILPHNLGNLSKGRIVMLYKEFQNKERGSRHPQHNYIMKDFTLLIALFHGLELLVKHGSRVFLNFFDEHPEKSWIQSDDKLTALLERLRDDLGVNPLCLNTSVLPDGSVPEVPQNLSFGHPKFYKLKEIMLEHFKKAEKEEKDTRAIVFCEYRESVNLVHCLLLQCRPLIQPQMFVGQGASGKDGKAIVSQKQQLRVMRNFRSGVCNTLVATCVAEEGLDVGSVDLIICFDISTRSPIRLVQRCGRTGRERGGQVHILVTEGREHQTLQDCMRQRDGLNKKIQHSKEVQASLYRSNPRLVPHGFTPVCQKMYITVTRTDTKDDKKKGQKDLRTMLLGRASSSGSNSSNNLEAPLLTEEEFKEIYPEGYRCGYVFDKPVELWAKNKDSVKSLAKSERPAIVLSTWLEWQRTLQKTVNIGHSKDTEILSSLLQYSDAKRFEMPASTQNPTFNTQDFTSQKIIPSPSKTVTNRPASPKPQSPAKPKQQNKKKQKLLIVKSPGKRDGDIRALFSTATKSTKSYTKLVNDLGIQNDGSISTSMIDLLVDLSLNNHNNETKTCYICANVCDCSVIKGLRSGKTKPASLISFLKEPKLPDINLIDDIDAEMILKCAENDSGLLETQREENVSYFEVENKNVKNFELEFDFDSLIDLTSPDNKDVKIEDSDVKNEVKSEKNFDIGDIEDIFVDTTPEEAATKPVKIKDKNLSEPKEALGFFGLDSIDDIFADSDDSINNNIPNTPEKVNESSKSLVSINKKHEESPKTFLKSTLVETKFTQNDRLKSNTNNSPQKIQTSPSILSGKTKAVPTSPILCSQVRKFKLSTKKNQMQSSTPNSSVKRCLIPEDSGKKDDSIPTKDGSSKAAMTAKRIDKSKIETTQNNTVNKSMFTITQLVEMINKTGDKSTLPTPNINIDNKINLDDEDRSTSPILLTQAEKKKLDTTSANSNKSKKMVIESKKSTSLIILESDSESDIDENDNDNTQLYDSEKVVLGETEKLEDNERSLSFATVERNNTHESSVFKSPESSKRKISFEEDKAIASPFFNKRQKVEESNKKLTLQQKVLAALTSNKMTRKSNHDNDDNKRNVNFMISPTKLSQKENLHPIPLEFSSEKDDKEEYVRKSNLEMLQMFRRDSKVATPKIKFESIAAKANQNHGKRKLTFSDSDDDFIDSKNARSQKTANGYHEKESTTNHKVRKKKRKPASDLLDLEADLSSDQSVSGDELSDDSVGSIVDFICDDNITHHEDMQAVYIRSVKSPVKGTFKIPELPKKYAKEDVFSQFVEEDNYEMDSFCVESHIGLTQANDISDLEVAELLLEDRRSKKKRPRRDSLESNDESPVIRRKKKTKIIKSDSEDSS